MNFSNRVHWWAKATMVCLVIALLSSIVWFFNVPDIVYFVPSIFWLTMALAYYRWMDIAEKELAVFQENEPVLSKEIN